MRKAGDSTVSPVTDTQNSYSSNPASHLAGQGNKKRAARPRRAAYEERNSLGCTRTTQENSIDIDFQRK